MSGASGGKEGSRPPSSLVRSDDPGTGASGGIAGDILDDVDVDMPLVEEQDALTSHETRPSDNDEVLSLDPSDPIEEEEEEDILFLDESDGVSDYSRDELEDDEYTDEEDDTMFTAQADRSMAGTSVQSGREEDEATASARVVIPPSEAASSGTTARKRAINGELIMQEEIPEVGLVSRPLPPPEGGEVPAYARPLPLIEEPFAKWIGPLPPDQLRWLGANRNPQKATNLSLLYRATPAAQMRDVWENKLKSVPEGTIVNPLLKPTQDRRCFYEAREYLNLVADPDPIVVDWNGPFTLRTIRPESITTGPDCLREGMAYAHGDRIPFPALPTDDITMPLLRSFPKSYNPADLEEEFLLGMTGPGKEIATDADDRQSVDEQRKLQMRLFRHNHVAEDLGIAHMDLGAARHAMMKTLQMLPSNTEVIKVFDNINSPECKLALRAAVRASQEAMGGEMGVVGLDLEHESSMWAPARLYGAKDFLEGEARTIRDVKQIGPVVKNFLIAMGYPDGWERVQRGLDYREPTKSGAKRAKRDVDLNKVARDITVARNDYLRYRRLGIDMASKHTNGPYVATVQICAPGGLTFVALACTRDGTLDPEWVDFFTNQRIVKIMIAANGDNTAMLNSFGDKHPGIGLTWHQGVLDLQAIYHWPEIKDGGVLGALEIAKMAIGFNFKGESGNALAFKSTQQQRKWIPTHTAHSLPRDQVTYGGLDAIMALQSGFVLLACRPEFCYRISNSYRNDRRINWECHVANQIRGPMFLSDDETATLFWYKEAIHREGHQQYEPYSPKPLILRDLEEDWRIHSENCTERYIEKFRNIRRRYLVAQDSELHVAGNQQRFNLIVDLIRLHAGDIGGVFGQRCHMYPYRDRRDQGKKGFHFGPCGTQADNRPGFLVENAYSTGPCGEKALRLGFNMAQEMTDFRVTEHRMRSGMDLRGQDTMPGLPDTLLIIGARRHILLRLAIWQAKFVPETMVGMEEITNCNQFNRVAITHSVRRYADWAHEFRLKAIAQPHRLSSATHYGYATRLADGEVMRCEGKVGSWFWKTTGETYERDYQNYVAAAEVQLESMETDKGMVENQAQRRRIEAGIHKLKKEVELVKGLAERILNPQPFTPKELYKITVPNPLVKEDIRRTRHVVAIGEMEGEEDLTAIHQLGRPTVREPTRIVEPIPETVTSWREKPPAFPVDENEEMGSEVEDEDDDGNPINYDPYVGARMMELDMENQLSNAYGESSGLYYERPERVPNPDIVVRRTMNTREREAMESDLRPMLEERRELYRKRNEKWAEAARKIRENPRKGNAQGYRKYEPKRKRQPKPKSSVASGTKYLGGASGGDSDESDSGAPKITRYDQLVEYARPMYDDEFIHGNMMELEGMPQDLLDKRIALQQLAYLSKTPLTQSAFTPGRSSRNSSQESRQTSRRASVDPGRHSRRESVDRRSRDMPRERRMSDSEEQRRKEKDKRQLKSVVCRPPTPPRRRSRSPDEDGRRGGSRGRGRGQPSTSQFGVGRAASGAKQRQSQPSSKSEKKKTHGGRPTELRKDFTFQDVVAQPPKSRVEPMIVDDAPMPAPIRMQSTPTGGFAREQTLHVPGSLSDGRSSERGTVRPPRARSTRAKAPTPSRTPSQVDSHTDFTDRPWFSSGYSLILKEDPEPVVDFGDEDVSFRVPMKTILDVIRKNQDRLPSYVPDSIYPSFPIQLRMRQGGVHPFIPIQAMSWLLFEGPGYNGEAKNPFMERMPKKMFDQYFRNVTQTHNDPLAFITTPLLGAGGYQPTMEEMWRFMALLSMLMIFEQTFLRISAMDLANIIYFQLTTRNRALCDIICRREFPENYVPDDPREAEKARLKITEKEGARFCLMEAILTLRLFRRMEQLNPNTVKHKPGASIRTLAEATFEHQRLLEPKIYCIQAWDHADSSTPKTRELQMKTTEREFIGRMSTRDKEGRLQQADALKSKFTAQTLALDTQEYETFRKIRVYPLAIIQDYHQYCEAIAKAKDNPVLMAKLKEIRMDRNGFVNMLIPTRILAGKVQLDPLNSAFDSDTEDDSSSDIASRAKTRGVPSQSLPGGGTLP